ncbi:MAG TPA: hypothetical protein VG389_21315 [Myxococcota bacterium]|jgi:hypothetical protein|nr:hypothetical protein [Myxococcota bacterium]
MVQWIFIGVMGLWSVLMLLFAFKEPPERMRHFFRVPAIFVFLPEKWVMPVGRLFAGLLGLGFTGFLASRLL